MMTFIWLLFALFGIFGFIITSRAAKIALDMTTEEYDALIPEGLSTNNQKVVDYFEKEWKPVFIEDWIIAGKLMEVSRGDLVYSSEQETFVEPDPDPVIAEQQKFDTLLQWTNEAVTTINNKHSELMTSTENTITFGQLKVVYLTLRYIYTRAFNETFGKWCRSLMRRG